MSEQENVKVEEMADFFNNRAGTYDSHMKETINSFNEYYLTISDGIVETNDIVEILDLGCGTGLEIEGILKKVPNARITCIDLSEGMLKLLDDKYKDYKNQLTIINNSYLTHPFEMNKYDYVVSVMTMHHFKYEDKCALYKKIKGSLKEDGKYIEGDYVVSSENELLWLEKYDKILSEIGDKKIKLYHIDIPFSLETQKKLLKEAGFNNFEIMFEEGEHFIYCVC
ncbi:class I SAM-dependent methyltransferase [Brassicibacter mesophilus]|uniref:class I SAM-dependent methyltransferase n=1 Tax=Brassicibacter mesophilus TaxID=745119 RepID=UPI003D2508BE